MNKELELFKRWYGVNWSDLANWDYNICLTIEKHKPIFISDFTGDEFFNREQLLIWLACPYFRGIQTSDDGDYGHVLNQVEFDVPKHYYSEWRQYLREKEEENVNS